MAGEGPGKKRLLLHAAAAAVILLAGFAVYSTSLTVPFLFDDRLNIADNPYIRVTQLTPSQLKRAAVQDANQLRLFSNLTFGLDYYFHGLDLRGLRLANIALHGLCGTLLYLLVFSLLPMARTGLDDKTRFKASLLAALVWLAHPAHVQAVTYLVQRQTVLAALGVLGTVLFYVRARSVSGRARAAVFYFLSGVFLVIAVLSKEIGITAPAFILLFEFMFAGREGAPKKERRVIVASLAALVALALAAAAVLFTTGILASYLETYAELGYGPLERVLTQGRVIVRYLLMIVFPDPRFYALDQEVLVSRSLFSPWTTLPALLMIALIGGGSLALFRRRPVAAFCGLGFLIALAPESSLVPIELMFDHRIYLPSLFILPPAAAAVVIRLGPRRSVPCLVICALLLAAVTLSRNRGWQSELEVWRDSAMKSPGLARPWANLCAALVGEGMEERNLVKVGKAALYCERSLRLGADDPHPLVNLGVSRWQTGRPEEARRLFREAADNHPDSAFAHYNYGVILEMGGADGSGPDPEAALAAYERALLADAFHYQARLRRLSLLVSLGRRSEAEAEREVLNRMFPDRRERTESALRGAVSPAGPGRVR